VPVRIVEVVGRDAELLEVVLAPHTRRGGLHPLHAHRDDRGQHERHRDDTNETEVLTGAGHDLLRNAARTTRAALTRFATAAAFGYAGGLNPAGARGVLSDGPFAEGYPLA
jgi:hypothetical protein